MKTFVYFAKNGEKTRDFPTLCRGYGFDGAGNWRRRPLPAEAEGLVLDDRFLPCSAGLTAALAALSAWQGVLVLDFERPRAPLLAALAESLRDRDTVVPPAYGELPHGAVLVGPYPGAGSFLRWLEAQRRRWGAVVLDGAPLRRLLRPGRPGSAWTGPLPESGWPCPGALCLHRRLEDGAVLLWDTHSTLEARSAAAGVPVIAAAEEWEAVPP